MIRILFFSSKNCKPCERLEKVLASLTVYDKIDVEEDANTSLVTEYGIKSAPTLIKLKNDKETCRHVGFSDQKSVEKFVNY